MPKEFILATGNPHKAEEFNELLDPSVLLVKAAPDKLDVIEDGDSFAANALLKAKAYFEKYQSPVMADDSGLEVDALPGELGIHTARFGGDGLSAQQRYELLLDRMKEVITEERGAEFVCVLCFYFGEEEYYFFEGRMKGRVGTEAKGLDGFGYDPVFEAEASPEGETVAMIPEWKNNNSHRANAVKEAVKFFQ